MRIQTKKIALYGVLIAVAFILSYVESLIPAFFAVPGMKLGLSNLVVIVSLYLIGWKSAASINLVRIVLAAILFGTVLSLAYSFAGALVSLLVMIILKKIGKFSTVVVSIAGGVCHNIGQIIVAMIVLNTRAIGWYLLILWFTGVAAGAVIGIIGGILIKRLKPLFEKGLGRA